MSQSTRAEIVRAWWRAHIGEEAPDRGLRARLRRCDDPRDALGIPAALVLGKRLGADKDETGLALERALGLAIVLAHVREDDPRHPMRAAGWRKFPGQTRESDAALDTRPLLSELRFRRLLQSAAGPELIDAFRRLVKLLGEKASVGELGASFLDWAHPDWGERVRRNWALHYYNARAEETAVEETERP